MSEHPPQEKDLLPFGRLVLILACALTIMIALSLWALGTLRSLSHARRPDGMRVEQSLGPPRARQGVEEAIFALTRPALALKRAQLQSLSQLGWVDRERGIVRIPVDVAIDVELARAGAGGKR